MKSLRVGQLGGVAEWAKRADLFYVAAMGLRGISPVLLTPLQIIAAGSAPYGRILIASLAVQIIAGVAGLGTPQAVALHVRSVIDSGPTAILIRLLPFASLAAAATAGVGAALVSLGPTSLRADEMLICALPGVLLALASFSLECLRAAGRAQGYLTLTASAVLGAPVAGTLALFFGGRLTAYLVAWSAGLLLSMPLAVRLLGTEGRGLHPGTISLKPLIRSGAPLIGSSIFATVILLSDRLAVQSRLSDVAVSQYQVAFVLGGIGMQAAAALNIPWLPRIVLSGDRARTLTAASARFSFAVALGIAGTLLVASPYLAVSLGPGDVAHTALIVALGFAGVTLIQPLYFVAYDAAYAAGATAVMARIVVASSVLQTSIIWILTPQLGLAAAVAANAISQIVQVAYLAKASGTPVLDVWRVGTRPDLLWPGVLGVAIAVTLALTGHTWELVAVGAAVALVQLTYVRRRGVA